MWYFTADLHLDHNNIIDYTSRPFKTVNEMNETLINNWNEIIQADDIVVVVGDFTLHTNRELVEKRFVSRLKGSKIFLKGDHDYWLERKTKHLYHRGINGDFVVCCHWPMRSWKLKNYGAFNIHGHWHHRTESYPRQFNVGVDLNNFYPVSLETIKKRSLEYLKSFLPKEE